MTISREELAAFADGELSEERRAEVAAAVAADPELARQVEAHRALRARLAGHFAPVASEPVPDALAALLRPKEAEVIDFAAARKQIEAKQSWPRWGWIAGTAIAASLALAVFLPGGSDQPSGYAGEQLAGVLDNQLVADQVPGADTRILLSFNDESGDICRAFSGGEGAGIACRDDKGWRLEALRKGSEATDSEYRMAGASDADILARAQEMASGPALDATDEAAARKNGWR